MKAIGVIPARYHATRFEGKLLADLAGKPVLQHVFERAKESTKLSFVLIACDDQRILDVAQAFGAQAVMTSTTHVCGSDRIIEVVENIDCDIVVNIQGDEPLIRKDIIDSLVMALHEDGKAPVATVIYKIESQQDLENPNLVKVVADQNGYALYFSRCAIPYNRLDKKFENLAYWGHLGLYAYKKKFLMGFHQLPVSDLEKTEKLEQLRILQAGYKIKTVQTEHKTIGVDTKEDLKRVEEIFKKNL